MAVRGVFTSHSGIIGEQQTDISGRVLQTLPGGTAPLLALTSGMESENLSQVNWSWIEDTHITGNQTVVTGGNTTATSIVVDDLGIWVAGTVLLNQNTGEHLLVTSVVEATKTVNISRGMSGTTAATISTSDKLQSLGSAHAEAAGKPDPVSQNGEMYTNFVQIFKNGWALSGTARAIGFITGSKVTKNKADCFAYHAEDIERAFLWGKKGTMPLNGNQLRTTHGIVPQIEDYGGLVVSANTGSSAGDLSMLDFFDFMRQLFDVRPKGKPNERIAFTSSYVMQQIQAMIMQDSVYNIQGGLTSYGFAVYSILGLNGTLKLMTHPLMSENATWEHEVYVMHPGLIKKKVLRPTWSEEFDSERQNNNGNDSIEGYIGDEIGVELQGARCQGIYRNIQSGVASF